MTEKMPRIRMSKQVQDALARDPELAKAMKIMNENFLNAMQGVMDGRYPDFDEAMFALTGHHPERMTEEKYESLSPEEKAALHADISEDDSEEGALNIAVAQKIR